MKPIEKLDMMEYAVPRILLQRGKGKGYTVVEVIDGMLGKIDELVERVNILSWALDEIAEMFPNIRGVKGIVNKVKGAVGTDEKENE